MSKTVVNKKAPTVATDYDILGGRDSMAEYYKIKLEKQRSKEAGAQLSDIERRALEMPSDLDILTTKILVKLKVLSDYDPLLNTMRALTGHEDRTDIARELATRHYNKSVTDHFVGQFVSTTQTSQLLGALGRDRTDADFAGSLRGQLQNAVGGSNQSWATITGLFFGPQNRPNA